MLITSSLLISHGACAPQAALFAGLYPDGLESTVNGLMAAYAAGLRIAWAWRLTPAVSPLQVAWVTACSATSAARGAVSDATTDATADAYGAIYAATSADAAARATAEAAAHATAEAAYTAARAAAIPGAYVAVYWRTMAEHLSAALAAS